MAQESSMWCGLTVEVEKVIIGTCIILLFVHNAFDIRMQGGGALYAQTQTTGRAAGILFEPWLQTWTANKYNINFSIGWNCTLGWLAYLWNKCEHGNLRAVSIFSQQMAQLSEFCDRSSAVASG